MLIESLNDVIVHQPGWNPEPHLLNKPLPADTPALFPSTGLQESV